MKSLFIKFIACDGKDVFINRDHISKIRSDEKESGTKIQLIGEKGYSTWIKESVEEVFQAIEDTEIVREMEIADAKL